MQPGRTNDEAPAPDSGADRLPRSVERPEVLFAAVFIPIAVFSWVGILLAESGAFTGRRVVAGGAVLTALALTVAWRDLRNAGVVVLPAPRGGWITLGMILALSAAFFSRPGEFIIEGADASVYVATGRHIERTGRINSADPLVTLMPQELRESFFMLGRPDRRHEALLPGGLPIAADGTVKPSFFHLLPVWIAIATAAIGTSGAYIVNVVLAALGVVAVYLIGRRLWSSSAGVVAAVLLAVNFGQIYYARLPSSEMLAQFLVLSGILFTALAWDLRARVAGACAGAAVGLAAFTRVDALLLIVPLAAIWLAQSRRSQSLGRAWPWYAGMLAFVSAHAALHGVTVCEIYTRRLLSDGLVRVARVSTHVDSLSAFIVAVALVAIAIVAVRLGRRSLVWAGLCAAVALAWLSPPVIVMLGRLLSPVGMAAAVAGLAFISVRHMEPKFLPLIVLPLAQVALLLAWSEITILPEDFRRAVPILLPSATLLIGFLVAHIGGSRARAARIIWLLPAGLAAVFLFDAAPILRTPPMQHVDAQLAQLAGHVPPKSLVLTDGSVPGHLALALHYSFERPAVRLVERPATENGIAPLVAAAIADGRQVFVAAAPMVDASPNRIQRKDFADFNIRQEAAFRLRYHVVALVIRAYPRRIRLDEVPVVLYRVEPRDRETRAALPLVIDVGTDDFGSTVDGFHGSEDFQSMRGRWTNGEARVALPRVASPQSGMVTLVLRLSAGRPQGHAPVGVRIAIDGISGGAITGATPDVREYRIPLSPAAQERLLAGPTILSISSDAFVPKAAGMGDDQRRLGIALDWVRVE